MKWIIKINYGILYILSIEKYYQFIYLNLKINWNDCIFICFYVLFFMITIYQFS